MHDIWTTWIFILFVCFPSLSLGCFVVFLLNIAFVCFFFLNYFLALFFFAYRNIFIKVFCGYIPPFFLFVLFLLSLFFFPLFHPFGIDVFQVLTLLSLYSENLAL